MPLHLHPPLRRLTLHPPTLHHHPPTHRTPSPLHQTSQTRHATLIRRPQRPYTFTQLVTLSDGSSFLHRTTSPAPVYVSTKDTRNSPLWNPSSQRLMNMEVDEAGKLRAFREKFGRGWDAERMDDGEGGEGEREDNLMDLITGFGEGEGEGDGAVVKEMGAKGMGKEKEKGGGR